MASLAILLCGPSVTSGQSAGGVFRGTVRDAGSGTPIPDVELILDNTSSSRSSAKGEFQIIGIATGTHVVVVRRIGFTPLLDSIRMAGVDTIRSVYRLTESATALAPVVITAAERLRNRRLADFENRKSLGFGKFLTPEDWKGRSTVTLKNILDQDVQGVYVVGNRLASRRGARPNCFLAMYVDGRRVSTNAPPPLDNFQAEDLLGVEVYRGPSETPLQFSGTDAQCGALVVWTR